MWLRAASIARAQCSGAAEEWLCRLGRARHWQGLVRTGAAVAVAVPMATGGYGRRRCRHSEAEQNQGSGRQGSCAAERALRLFGSGGEGGRFGIRTFGPPLV